jgi:hypothetical protein
LWELADEELIEEIKVFYHDLSAVHTVDLSESHVDVGVGNGERLSERAVEVERGLREDEA